MESHQQPLLSVKLQVIYQVRKICVVLRIALLVVMPMLFEGRGYLK